MSTHIPPPTKPVSAGFFPIIKAFLNHKTGTMSITAMSLVVGFAFRDLIVTFVSSFLIPLLVNLLVFILVTIKLNAYFDLDQFISDQNSPLNITKCIHSVITFCCIIVVSYFVFAQITD